MTKNMGTIDRGIRIVIAIAVGVLYFTGQISGAAAVILGLLAVIFVLTSLVGICPLYLPFGLSTRGKSA
jgi:Na+(H+)/acetate symporter ActP